jgi:hypothetical protein
MGNNAIGAILTFEDGALGLQTRNSSNPLTQFNYSSLQGVQPNSIFIRYIGGKSFDVGSEENLVFFATASFSNDFHLKAMEQQKPV